MRDCYHWEIHTTAEEYLVIALLCCWKWLIVFLSHCCLEKLHYFLWSKPSHFNCREGTLGLWVKEIAPGYQFISLYSQREELAFLMWCDFSLWFIVEEKSTNCGSKQFLATKAMFFQSIVKEWSASTYGILLFHSDVC